MAIKRLSLIQGNSQTHTVTLNQADGRPYCIKNWVVFFTLKSNAGLPDSQAAIQKIVTTFSDSTGGTSGIALIPILPQDTINLDPGEYDFDITVTTNNNDHYTVIKGKYDIEYSVTKSLGTAGTA